MVEARFGLAAYAARVETLLESFNDPAPDPARPDNGAPPVKVEQSVRRAFATAAHVRLLFD